jgi:DNA helicase-2/ATP-dependent DNA helicase PcrA
LAEGANQLTKRTDPAKHRELLLAGLQGNQPAAVRSTARRMLLVAGAGSGKTEVMARRVAWWLVDGIPKDSIVAFTFTEKAAEEMKFRIRRYVELITPEGTDTTLGGMYIGTIHSFCMKLLKDLAPSDYHNYEVVDEIARYALVQQRFHNLLGLLSFQKAISQGKKQQVSVTRTSESFLYAYDLLNEYNELSVELPNTAPPTGMGPAEEEWCKQAQLLTDLGTTEVAQAFAKSAARLYAYMRCRRFLDFSTCQSEAVRLLSNDPMALDAVRQRITHIVVDEVQDVNVVQDALVRLLVGEAGHLTAVGDHRQAIFGWRGGRVEIMAELAGELVRAGDGEVLELTQNFRSTPRVIDVSNQWNKTIGVPANLTSPDMLHGRKTRTDSDPSHVAALQFPSRAEEAEWIAKTINQLVVPATEQGAPHDTNDGERGISYSDIAVLLRSSTDARTYMLELRAQGIPAVVRAGPDLFSQPEVLFIVGALGLSAGFDKFFGGQDKKSLPSRISDTLGCAAEPIPVIHAAAAQLRSEGVPLAAGVEQRLIAACQAINARISDGNRLSAKDVQLFETRSLREFLSKGPQPLRRVFPQAILHDILSEAGLGAWDAQAGRSSLAMFHIGQLSTLVTGIETPGWTSTSQYRYQISALLLWGTQKGRIEEAPLLVTPDAVQITTIHAAKGLEFPCVFVADVASLRFPSSQARKAPNVPFDGAILTRIDPAQIADNAARDGERRLMYVALTRSERYLFVTSSKPSEYFAARKKSLHPGVADIIQGAGGNGPTADPRSVPGQIRLRPSETSRESRLVTSFSDIRYFLECPHDFYLRKVLGFTPTINQAFGYGRGIHNLLREIHSDAQSWAAIATDRDSLLARINGLVDRGLFYLRHTVGDPAENMRKQAVGIVADYVQTYAAELARLRFEPEREFETLIEEAAVLVSGSIDLIRLDDPARVSIIDFKSGHAESDARMSLDEDEMRLQITMYGLAARKELEYEAESGLVRYLGETEDGRRELPVDLNEQALTAARNVIVQSARSIRDREFKGGPLRAPRKAGSQTRCDECDFKGICGTNEAQNARARE